MAESCFACTESAAFEVDLSYMRMNLCPKCYLNHVPGFWNAKTRVL